MLYQKQTLKVITFLVITVAISSVKSQIGTSVISRKLVCRPIKLNSLHRAEMNALKSALIQQSRTLTDKTLKNELRENSDTNLHRITSCKCSQYLNSEFDELLINKIAIIKSLHITSKLINEGSISNMKFSRRMQVNLTYCYAVYWSVLNKNPKKLKSDLKWPRKTEKYARGRRKLFEMYY